MFYDLAIGNVVDADASERDGLVARRDIHERFSAVRLSLRPAFHYFIPFSDDVFSSDQQIWERCFRHLVNLFIGFE